MEKEKILIIDDDPGIRKTLSDILRIKGYEPFVAKTGAEGMDILKQLSADLVVIDLGLPDMPGLDVLNRVKTDKPLTEAIILTGNASLDSAIEATNNGAFSYLLKPYGIDQLMLHVSRALEKKRAQETIATRNIELERTNAELQAQYEVSLAISRTMDMDELFSEILKVFSELTILSVKPKCCVFLVEKDGMRLVSRVGFEESEPEPCRTLEPGECLCGLAAQAGDIIISTNSSHDERHKTDSARGIAHGHIIVPLKTANKVVGVLCLFTAPDISVDDRLLNLLRSIGGQIGIAAEHARLYEETKSSSLHDPLTGLANRRFMEIQLHKSFESAKRYGSKLSAIMLDIDHFKRYNDAYGHVEGDKLLVKIAHMLSNNVRDADYVFRYGGEEFLVLLPDIDLSMACLTAERLRNIAEAEIGVTISLGVSSASGLTEKEEDLIAASDNALYAAKQKGRNRIEKSC